MFWPDCICVCSFSTTSPSPIRSWVTLMPVIAEKAGASTLDSYSCVVMVSETTVISMPRKGSAASMNHCISASCSARLSAERSPISSSRNALASLMSASAGPVIRPSAATMAVVVVNLQFLLFLPRQNLGLRGHARTARTRVVARSDPAEDRRGIDQADDQRPPLRGAEKPEPGQIDEGRAQKRDEKTIAARRLDAQDPGARGFRVPRGEDREDDQQRRDHREESGRGPCPCHPVHVVSSR